MLGGVVLEYAAVGQHAAATAREYGLPAVINCRDLMLHIHDGDVIHIDGTTGIITLDPSKETDL
jgi:pyruvate,water dikinase